MEFNGARRILAALPIRPNKPSNPDWIRKAEQKQAQTPEKTNKVPEDTFSSKSPSQIANELKTKSESFEQAISRLQYYVNRSGEKISDTDRHKMDQAKEALYRAYGRPLPNDSYGS